MSIQASIDKALQGNPEVLIELLKSGADTTGLIDYRTPLTYAMSTLSIAERGDTQALESLKKTIDILLNSNMDPNQKDRHGHVALYLADCAKIARENRINTLYERNPEKATKLIPLDVMDKQMNVLDEIIELLCKKTKTRPMTHQDFKRMHNRAKYGDSDDYGCGSDSDYY